MFLCEKCGATLGAATRHLIAERDHFKHEADTLAETLRIVQARCTELVEHLRRARDMDCETCGGTGVLKARVRQSCPDCSPRPIFPDGGWEGNTFP